MVVSILNPSSDPKWWQCEVRGERRPGCQERGKAISFFLLLLSVTDCGGELGMFFFKEVGVWSKMVVCTTNQPSWLSCIKQSQKVHMWNSGRSVFLKESLSDSFGLTSPTDRTSVYLSREESGQALADGLAGVPPRALGLAGPAS